MSVVDWLLDSDPALRWQVLRDLTGAPADVVAAERARVATAGWGAELLARRDPDGQWAGGACFPADFGWDFSRGQPWTATLPTLQLLRDLGVYPADPAVRDTVALVARNSRWEHEGQAFFDGEVEPCINGRLVAVGAYFLEGGGNADVEGVVDRLLADQLADGGWNCEAENGSVRSSFHSTICVLEGLLEHERSTCSTRTAEARRRGEEYLLDRGLLRRRGTGELVDPDWLRPAFPTWWHYDVLRGLDHLRTAGPPDPRAAEAVEVLRDRRTPDGTWLLEQVHPGAVHVTLDESAGRPSRWTTLRALRVLRWWDGADLPGQAGTAS